MRTGYVTARTTGRRTWLSCVAWLSIWPRWSPRKRRSRVSSSAPDGITPPWSPSSPKPQKGKCDSPEGGGWASSHRACHVITPSTGGRGAGSSTRKRRGAVAYGRAIIAMTTVRGRPRHRAQDKVRYEPINEMRDESSGMGLPGIPPGRGGEAHRRVGDLAFQHEHGEPEAQSAPGA